MHYNLKSKPENIFLPALVAFVFILIGAGVVILGVRGWLEEDGFASRAVPVKCKIISAALEKSEKSYSPEIVYEYAVDGEIFRSSRIGFGTFSTNDYSREWRRMNELKTRDQCWIDPLDPHVSSLEKPEAGFAWHKMTLIAFGMIFSLIPGLALFLILREYRKKKNNAVLAVSGNAVPENLREQPETVVEKTGFSVTVQLVFSIVWTLFVCGGLCPFFYESALNTDWTSLDSVKLFFKECAPVLPFAAIFFLAGSVFFFKSLFSFVQYFRRR